MYQKIVTKYSLIYEMQSIILSNKRKKLTLKNDKQLSCS